MDGDSQREFHLGHCALLSMQTHTFIRLNIFEGYYLLGACGGPKQMYIRNGRQLTLLKSYSFKK